MALHTARVTRVAFETALECLRNHGQVHVRGANHIDLAERVRCVVEPDMELHMRFQRRSVLLSSRPTQRDTGI